MLYTATTDAAQDSHAIDIERELSAAQRFARHPAMRAPVDSLNLRIDAAPWGFAKVNITGETYQPADDGEPAFVVAAEVPLSAIEAERSPYDLVACRIRDRRTATRLGLAVMLGLDDVEAAANLNVSLPLFSDVLHWAVSGFRGAVLIDWKAARDCLVDVPAITVADHTTAARLHRAMTTPRISFVQREAHRAAA